MSDDVYRNGDGLVATLRVDRVDRGGKDLWMFGAEVQHQGKAVATMRPGPSYLVPCWESERDARDAAHAWLTAIGFKEIY